MNRSTVAIAALGYIVYCQARRIQRLNTALALVRAIHREEFAAADRQVERLNAENKVIRDENVAWCRQAVEGAS